MNEKQYNAKLRMLASSLVVARANKIRTKLVYSDALSAIEEVQKSITKLVKEGYNDNQ